MARPEFYGKLQREFDIAEAPAPPVYALDNIALLPACSRTTWPMDMCRCMR